MQSKSQLKRFKNLGCSTLGCWRGCNAEGQISDQITKAKMQGYEGDPCNECGNFTLVRNGTCLKCNTCGGTSGCS